MKKVYILTLAFLFSNIVGATVSLPMKAKVEKITPKQIHLRVRDNYFILNKKALPKHMARRMSQNAVSKKVYHVPLRSIASIKSIKKEKAKQGRGKKK